MSRVFGGLYGRVARLALGVGATAFALDSCLYNVEPGHRGIIFSRIGGIQQEVAAEGTHFVIPIIQRPIVMDVRTTPRTINTETGTKDLQNVNLTLRVLCRPNVQFLSSIYQKLGTDYADRVLPSLTNEVLKQVVAQYDADQLLTLRDKVSLNLRDALYHRCREFNLELDDVSITHLNFSKDFAKAIEDKQVAEQMAERAKFVVQKAEQEKIALITRSEGDAEAAQLVSDAFAKNGTGLIEIRRLETAQQVADNLCRSSNITFVPATSNMLLNLPNYINQQQQQQQNK